MKIILFSQTRLFLTGMILFALMLSANLVVENQCYGFESSEGGFSIEIPGEPSLKEKVHDSFLGKVIEKNHVFNNTTEDYNASYTKLPAIGNFFLTDKTLLKKARKGFMDVSHAKELASEFIIFEGNEALMLDFKVSADTHIGKRIGPAAGKAIFVINKGIIYALVASTNRTAGGDEEINRFLGSFHFLPITNPQNF